MYETIYLPVFPFQEWSSPLFLRASWPCSPSPPPPAPSDGGEFQDDEKRQINHTISLIFHSCLFHAVFFGQVIFGSSCSWRWREARHRSKKKKNKFERLFCIVRETEFSHQTPWQGVLPPPPLPPPPLVMVTAVSQYLPDIVIFVVIVVFQVRLRNYHTLSTWFYFASSCLRCGKIWIFANEGLRRQDQFWP